MTTTQDTQISRIMKKALQEANLNNEVANRLITHGDDFKAKLVKMIRQYSTQASDFTLAREILGNSFLPPKEIATALDITYSEEQVAELEHTLPDRETLEWLKKQGYMLVAGPPHEMSLPDILEIDKDLFQGGSWYPRKPLAWQQKMSCQWYMIREGIVPNSTDKNWGWQLNMLNEFEHVPTADELIWGLICKKAVTGHFVGAWAVRTRSVASQGGHLIVHVFSNKFKIDSHFWDSLGSSNVGIASYRPIKGQP